MAKEWILNSAMNRFQLNFSRNVGKVSGAIRLCAPKDLSDWEKYYYSNVRSKEHLVELGQNLYVKITEVISAEIEELSEDDCISYIQEVVLNRTYDGYTTEIRTIYGQLAKILGCKIVPAPDEWDRFYNVDFFIKANKKYIGLQIKPFGNTSHNPQIFQEHAHQRETHQRFTSEFGGKGFHIFSIKDGNSKNIHNTEVIDEIREEIRRLSV